MDEYTFMTTGNTNAFVAEIVDIRAKALKLINGYEGRMFSWPLDGYGGDMGYWLHVSILRDWSREREEYDSFARTWLADDRNILMCMLAVERQRRQRLEAK
jgi:hypothetical protein